MALSPLPPTLIPVREEHYLTWCRLKLASKITFISQLLYSLISVSRSTAIDGAECTLAPCAVNNGGVASL